MQHGSSFTDILRDEITEAVLGTHADAIIAADRSGAITFWNPGAERIFGHTRSSALGRPLDIIIPENLRKRHGEGFNRVMAGGKSQYGEGDILAVPAVRKDGTRVSVEFTIAPLRDDAGQLTGLVAVLRDVTKRFEEMRALRQKLVNAAVS